jgi:chaperonin cofactor prefoldin
MNHSSEEIMKGQIRLNNWAIHDLLNADVTVIEKCKDILIKEIDDMDESLRTLRNKIENANVIHVYSDGFTKSWNETYDPPEYDYDIDIDEIEHEIDGIEHEKWKMDKRIDELDEAIEKRNELALAFFGESI